MTPCSGCGLRSCDGRCFLGEDNRESDHICPSDRMCPECWSMPMSLMDEIDRKARVKVEQELRFTQELQRRRA